MALHVDRNREQYTGFIVSVVFAPVCIIATVLRFVATRRLNRKPSWDDYHALLALVFFLAYIGYALWTFSSFNGRPIPLVFKTDPNLIKQSLKVGNIMNGLYGLQQSFAKFSLLALYNRLFWVDEAFSVSVRVVAGLQAAWGIVVLLVHIFACRPMAKIWDIKLKGYCIDSNVFFSIYEPFNSALDFAVAGLAIWMLQTLQIRRVTLWRLSIVFALGAFSGIIGIIKVVEAQNSAQKNFQSVIWNIAQMATSVICCCAPIYQSILPKVSLYDRISSWASTTFGSRRFQPNSSSHSGSRTYSSAVIHQKRNEVTGVNHRANWLSLDGSSERALAWAEADPKEGLTEEESCENIPMGAVRVDRSVYVV